MSSLSYLNPNFHDNLKLRAKPERNFNYYVNGLKEGNRYILSECITLLESTVQHKRALGLKILDHFKDENPNTVRIGITGTPGVGKSTFIESMGRYFIDKGHRLAVLAIDPSSHINKGSILGDKTRMQHLSTMNEAFIRPTASGAILGGIALYTKETIKMCEAAGFDTIFIETVGIGQSEIEVGYMTDVNILMLQPGAGDDIQGIKRGVMENADIFIINKADGALLPIAKQSKVAYRNAIQLFHHKVEGWKSPIVLVSSTESLGLEEVYEAILRFKNKLVDLGIFNDKRTDQDIRWFYIKSKEISENIVFNHPEIKVLFNQMTNDIQNHKISPPGALSIMVQKLKSLIQ